MIRIKVYKLSQLITAAILALLVIAAIIVGAVSISNNRRDEAENTSAAMAQIGEPATSGCPVAADKPLLRRAAEILEHDAAKFLAAQLPFQPRAVPVTAEGESPDVPDQPERIRVEIENIREKYQHEEKADKPRVLIYHTHTYEAFEQNPDDPYPECGKWRTEDSRYNIVRVGDALAEELEALDIEVVHDTTEHEPPKLGTAYLRSLKTLEGYAQRGEEFDMMIDLHRDAASSRNTNPSCVTANGIKYARMMALIGNGKGRNGNSFSIKPNWKENYKLAQAVTDGLNAEVPGICRDVMVKNGRYNQHMSENAVLIEVGHNKNTLEEAVNAAKPLAKVIAGLLLSDESKGV